MQPPSSGTCARWLHGLAHAANPFPSLTSGLCRPFRIPSMNGVRLGLYHPVRQWLKQGALRDSPVAVDVVAAGATGAAGAVAGNPFNVVKMRCMTVRSTGCTCRQ